MTIRLLAHDPSSGATQALELVLVLIGARSCAAHANARVAEQYRYLREALRQKAEAEQRRFRTIGVAVDADPDAGISFLRPFGPFDQAIVGGGWSNEGAVRFLWRDHRGEPSVPQLVVLRRELTLHPDVRITHEAVVRRAVGVRAMLAAAADAEGYLSGTSWLRAGSERKRMS